MAKSVTMDVEAILKQLTLEEKIGLLSGIDFWHTYPIPRLGVPSIRLSDGPNGVRGTRFFGSVPSSCLPCGTAIGATFDKELVHAIGHLLADEARAKGAHVVLGPTINIQRAPLGGRGFESFSEDPVLSGTLAAHYCSGLEEKGIAATPKHFVCNDMEHERMAVDSIVTDRALHEIYLLPFMIAIRDGHPQAIMTSYNKVNGIHASENHKLLQDILRDSWGFDGLVMSDWFGTYSTSDATNAGLDLEMPGPSRWRAGALNHSVNANMVSRRTIDNRVRNVLKLVCRAAANGVPEHAPEKELNRPEDRELLRKVAADAIVLLKNDSGVLPLRKTETVAVIGPNSKISTYCGGGSASLNPYNAVSPWEGIQSQAQGSLVFSQGIYGHQMMPPLGKRLKTDDGQVGFTLKIYNEPPTAKTRKLLETRHENDSNIFFIDYNHPDLNTVWYADAEGLFTPDVSGVYDFGLSVQGTGWLYVDGELLIRNAENQRPGASFLGSGTVEETGHKTLVAGKSYRILVQWGCSETSSLKVPGTIDFGHGGMRISGCLRLDPRDGIAEAVAVARTVSQVVLCVGLGAEWESEGRDRESMALPPHTDELVTAVLAANPNTVIVVQSGTPVSMPWLSAAKAVLHAWYGGNETGHAIADVVFGTVNPSGKLPLTFPHRLRDHPSHLNYRSEGGRCLYGEDIYVGYRFFDEAEVEPQFAFGHGLSYTTFSLTALTITRASKGKVHVTLTVTNTGPVPGSCAVQLYVLPPSGYIAGVPRRPVQELKAFAKVHDIAVGESRKAALDLDAVRDTSYWDEISDMWCSRQGSYGIRVGQSSRDKAALEGILEVEETTWWTGLTPEE